MKKYIFLFVLIAFAFSCGVCVAQEKWMCGIDLDEDGMATGLGETAECVTVGTDHICPLNAVYCTYPTTYPPDECPSGTTLNTVSDKCDVAPTNSCPAPYTLVETPSPGGCVFPVVCPGASSLNTETDLCEYVPTAGCDVPYIYNSVTDRCEVAPSCESGSTWNAALDRCEKVAVATCTPGTAYNVATGLCESVPNCAAGGTYNVALNRCETGLVPQVTGYQCSTNGSICPDMASCAGSCPDLPGVPEVCVLDDYYNYWLCPYDPFDTPCTIEYPECPDWNAWCCPAQGPIPGTCSEYITMVCPPGYILEGGNCISTTFTCNEGSTFNPAAYRCEATPSYFACEPQYTLDFFNRVCFTTQPCAEGTFDNVNDVCFRPSNSHCESGFIYNSASTLCVMSPVGLCGGGGPDSYSSVFDACTMVPIKGCMEGTVYSAATDRCEVDPTCDEHPGYEYYPPQDACINRSETTACPIPGRPCIQNLSGDYQCSAECFDTLAEGGTITTGGDDTWLTDDGPRDEAGNCIGEIYIFSGKQMECNKSGHKSGWKNCCLSGEPSLADDVGSGVSMYNMMQGIQTVYELAQITAWAYSLTPSITYTAGTPVAAAVETIVAGGSLIEGFASYAMAAFMNPATLIIAAIILIVQYFILDGSCTEEDMETAMMRDSGRCHEVGEYCSEEWSGIGCVQDTKVLCCFNSKLARIIHEQGRPQLNTFVPTWATILDDDIVANCRGFTPAEFQMLDFSKMDLSEYFGEITTKVQSQLEETIGDRIEDYYDIIQNKK